MNIFFGLAMLVAGLIEFKKGKKIGGWMLVCVFILFIFTAILRLFSYNLSSNSNIIISSQNFEVSATSHI